MEQFRGLEEAIALSEGLQPERVNHDFFVDASTIYSVNVILNGMHEGFSDAELEMTDGILSSFDVVDEVTGTAKLSKREMDFINKKLLEYKYKNRNENYHTLNVFLDINSEFYKVSGIVCEDYHNFLESSWSA